MMSQKPDPLHMIHVDIGSWTARPRIRDDDFRMTHREDGRVTVFVSEGEASIQIEDGQGEDNPLCEVQLTREMLQIALAALDATENTNAPTCDHGREADLGCDPSLRRAIDEISDRIARLETHRRDNQDYRTDRRSRDHAR
jgi:hypothetical protein